MIVLNFATFSWYSPTCHCVRLLLNEQLIAATVLLYTLLADLLELAEAAGASWFVGVVGS